MSQYDGRGKYLAVPITAQANSTSEVTQLTDVTSDTLVIANDFRLPGCEHKSPGCSQYREVSFRDDDVTYTENTTAGAGAGRQERSRYDPDKQSTFLYLAIIAFIVCPLCGVVALCYSVNARQSYREGDIESGLVEANCAKMFGVASIVTALTAMIIAGLMLASIIFFFPAQF